MALQIARVVAALFILLAAVLSQLVGDTRVGASIRPVLLSNGNGWRLTSTAIADNGDNSDNGNNNNSGDNGSSSNNNNSGDNADNSSNGNNNNSGDNGDNSSNGNGNNNNSGDNGDNSSNGNGNNNNSGDNGGDNVSSPAAPAPTVAPPASGPPASTTEASGASTGGDATIALPGNHVAVRVFPWMPPGITITVRLIDPATVPAPPGKRVGDLVFRLEARGAGGETLSALPAEVNLSATYADQDVVGLNEASVTLFWLDPTTNRWTPAPKLATDPSTNYVSASVTALGTYAVSIP